MKRWVDKRVVVLGLARQGKALARYLTNEGAMVVMSDIKTKDQLGSAITELANLDLTYVLGKHPVELLDDTDALFLSGGVPTDLPIVHEAHVRSIPVRNDAQIFLEICPSEVIGITGSAGKTTTTTLVYEMARLGFEGSDRNVWLGGNIGRSLLEDVQEIETQDVVVMELSSFQLELMTVSPNIAALLNLTPDHLDRHGSMKVYTEAKTQILAAQDKDSTAVIGYDDPRTWDLHNRAKGNVIAFGTEAPSDGDAAYVDEGKLHLRIEGQTQPICGVDELALRGPHNVLNVLAAIALSSAVQVPVNAMATVARTFQGVPHRLEFVRNVLGADWYNDSIATTPDRALAAVRSFDEPLVVLLGGRDKELVWEAFAREVISKAREIILFGEASPKLQIVLKPLLEGSKLPTLHLVGTFEQAMETTTHIVKFGDVVLLSPGCTSYDEFPNFEARGDRFKEMVRDL